MAKFNSTEKEPQSRGTWQKRLDCHRRRPFIPLYICVLIYARFWCKNARVCCFADDDDCGQSAKAVGGSRGFGKEKGFPVKNRTRVQFEVKIASSRHFLCVEIETPSQMRKGATPDEGGWLRVALVCHLCRGHLVKKYGENNALISHLHGLLIKVVRGTRKINWLDDLGKNKKLCQP